MRAEVLVPQLKEALSFFVFTLTELAILFVGISFLVGLIHEFLPQETVRRHLTGRNGKGYLLGAAFGSITPFCSCSTIPMTIGLIKANAGFGPTMTFLFTSPLVNPIIIPLFVSLLGIEVTVIYTLVALVMAIALGFALERMDFARYIINEAIIGHGLQRAPLAMVNQPQTATGAAPAPVLAPLPMARLQTASGCCSSVAGPTASAAPGEGSGSRAPGRWSRILLDAVSQFRNLLGYIILGVAIGAFIHGFLPADLVAQVAGADNPLAIPIAALAGIPLYLRVSTMVPIAATLVAKGMSLGAVIALIIGGAGASLPEAAMLKGIFRTPLLLAFLSSVLTIAITAGVLINALLI